MDAKLLIARVVLLAVLFATLLIPGGDVVRAELDSGAVGLRARKQNEGLAARYFREIGFPHNDLEACRMLMQFFR